MGSIYLNEKIAEGGFGLVFRVDRTERAVCGEMDCRTRDCVAKLMERKDAKKELDILKDVREKILDPEIRKSVVIDASMCEIDEVENYYENSNITRHFDDPVIMVFENAGIDFFTFITSSHYTIPINSTTLMQMEQFLYFLIILLFKYQMIHADIKMENIVYSIEKGYQLIDWGLATTLERTNDIMNNRLSSEWIVNYDDLYYKLPIVHLYHNLSRGPIDRIEDLQKEYFTRFMDNLLYLVNSYTSNFQEHMEKEIAKANEYFNGQNIEELQLQIMLKYDVFSMGIILLTQISCWYEFCKYDYTGHFRVTMHQLQLFIDYLLDRCIIGDVRKMNTFPELYLAYTSFMLHPEVINEIGLTEEDINHLKSRRNEVNYNDPSFNMYLTDFLNDGVSGIKWDIIEPPLEPDGVSTEELKIVDRESHFSTISEHAETDDISHDGGGTDKSNVHFPNRSMVKTVTYRFIKNTD